MNQKTVEKLFDKLADKTLSFGCEVEQGDGCKWRIIGKGSRVFEKFIMYSLVTGAILAKEPIRKGEKILGHPVRIGDVLEKMKLNKGDEYIDSCEIIEGVDITISSFIRLWQPCGFTKSLQEIAKEKPEGWKKLFEFLKTIQN